jgi:hypothetical protein
MITIRGISRLAGAATLLLKVLLHPGLSSAQANADARRTWPLTRPEATSHTETSRYDDVVSFMKAMAAASPRIHLTTYGYTHEGRAMPLAVIGAPDASPRSVLATGKTRVFLQGNIHAGEVEGKEALLQLLRSIAKGERDDWFRHVVLLITPIYNADGNERVSVANRGAQHGPVGGMGTRPNAQGLNLNRDAMKVETPEGRSLARFLDQYDPHVSVDLHTTNGSDHGYYLTYEGPGSPNTSPRITSLLREQLFPGVTKAVKAKHGWDFFYYGGASSRGGERAWYGDLDLYKPRYTHTYFGLRNRIGILSETNSYATFEDRIKAAYRFVEEIVNFAAGHGEIIRRVAAQADAESIIGTMQAVRGRLVRTTEAVPIVLARTMEERNPYVPDRPMRLRVNGSERVETMPHYGTIEATETSLTPRAYVIPLPAPQPITTPPPQRPPFGPTRDPGARMMASIVDRLETHGVRFTRTTGETSFIGERFRIESSKTDEREFEGHKLRTLTGAWETVEEKLPAGALVVPMDQPLARLAFLLLDPRSDDGLMAWNILDPILGPSPGPEFYPILRTMNP